MQMKPSNAHASGVRYNAYQNTRESVVLTVLKSCGAGQRDRMGRYSCVSNPRRLPCASGDGVAAHLARLKDPVVGAVLTDFVPPAQANEQAAGDVLDGPEVE